MIQCQECRFWVKTNHTKDRLMYLSLPTVVYRRAGGDMLELYKILHENYDSNIIPNLTLNNTACTRGNDLKLKHEFVKFDLRKYYFAVFFNRK